MEKIGELSIESKVLKNVEPTEEHGHDHQVLHGTQIILVFSALFNHKIEIHAYISHGEAEHDHFDDVPKGVQVQFKVLLSLLPFLD